MLELTPLFHRLSCFVAGTLVHTKEGLKPIEQIKVEDYVLSKPEDGSGEPEYKRVIRTFAKEKQEVWFVGYYESNPAGRAEERFVIATAEHPFFVKEIGSQTYYSDDVPENTICNTWKTTAELYEHHLEGNPIELMSGDGRPAVCTSIGPMLVSAESEDVGVIYFPRGSGEDNEGTAIDFSKGAPDYFGFEPFGDQLLPKSAFAKVNWLTDEQLEQLGSNAIGRVANSYTPILRKVYNLEVEDNHTYYVGKHGVLVHNTCKMELDPLHTINPNAKPGALHLTFTPPPCV